MYKVVVSNQCSCFKNSKMDGTLHFESREEAKNKALEMMKKMNEDFCGKHEFDVQEMFTSYVISFYNPARDNCCGNGCCM
jgi:TATA-box binding protein (TBP) (component of TFIID and TFIIIB)